MQAKKEDPTKDIRKKYKEFGGPETNQRVAGAIKVSAEIEYNNSYTLGWGGVYMVDRFQSMLTGRAMTTNTEKVLDAQQLETYKPK